MSHQSKAALSKATEVTVCRDRNTFEISLPQLNPAELAACATDLQTELQKGWPDVDVTVARDGKLDVLFPGSLLRLKPYQDMPDNLEGPVGGFSVYPARSGVDLAFTNTVGGEWDKKSGQRKSSVTAYANTEMYPKDGKLGFAPTEDEDEDKSTAGEGHFVRNPGSRHTASSFVPWRK